MSDVEKVEIGSVILYRGDCLQATELISRVDHTICDPPYEEEAHSEFRQVHGREGIVSRSLDFQAMDEATRNAITRLIVQKTNRWALFFCQVEANEYWRRAFEGAGGKYHGTMAWVKPDAKPNYRGTGPGVGYENIVTGWCGEGKSEWNGGGRTGVFVVNKNEKRTHGNTHMTIKPQKLMTELVALFTNKDEIIFDPFMGSGSTGVAAVAMGRKFIGIEREAEYFDISCKRIEDAQKGLFETPYVKTKARVAVSLLPETFKVPPAPSQPRPAPALKAEPAPSPRAKPAPSAKRFSPPTITVGDTVTPAGPVTSVKMTVNNPFTAPPVKWTAPSELPNLNGAKVIGLDCETRDEDLQEKGCGARRDNCYIVGLSVAIMGGPKWYLPVRHEGGGNMDPARVFNWARDVLNKFDGYVCGTNIQYDLDFLANERVTLDNVKGYHDIQIAEPILDANRLRYDLGTLAKDYLGVEKNERLLNEAAAAFGWKKQGDIKKNLWRLPAGYVGPYGEDDAELPIQIFAKQRERLIKENQANIYELERRLIPILVGMRRRGVPVDLDRAEQAGRVLQSEIDKWTAQVKRYAGPAAELMAAESLAPALRDRGIDVPITLKNKQPSITVELFNRYKGDPLVDAIAMGRRVMVLKNTFIDGHIFGNQINGRIHATYNQLKRDTEDGERKAGAASGRLSSENPNMQNLPARAKSIDADLDLGGVKVLQLIRGIFIPEAGEDFVSQDLSQIEYRYFAHFAVGRGADAVRQAYIDNPRTDFHKMCADFANIDPDNEDLRKGIKNLNFCKLYGGGIKKIAATMGKSEEFARAFNDRYDREIPCVKSTMEAAMNEVRRNGYVLTIEGRRQRFDMWEPKEYGVRGAPLPKDKALAAYGPDIKRAMIYAALNYKLQGSAADHFKRAMVKMLDAGIYKALGWPLALVHDEKTYSKPRTPEGNEAVKESQRILATAIEIKVPVFASSKEGPDWGSVS